MEQDYIVQLSIELSTKASSRKEAEEKALKRIKQEHPEYENVSILWSWSKN